MFIDHLTDLLTEEDFNMHVEDLIETDTIIFNETMQALGFKQHVTRQTHKKGNTLDLIFTEPKSEILVTNYTTYGYISDHSLITIDNNLNKEKYGKKVKPIWDPTKMTKENLEAKFTLPLLEATALLSQANNKEQQEMLDRVAPSKTIKVTNIPAKPWFNKYTRPEKSGKKQERTWKHCESEHQ